MHSSSNLEEINNIIENKIGFGRYQRTALLVLCFIDFSDGIEAIMMSLVLPHLKREWAVDELEIEIMSSFFYLGMFIGGTISSISDKVGRRTVLIFTSLAQGLTGILCAMTQNFYQMTIMRFIYGTIYGITLPLSTTLYCEMSPLKWRGKGIILINFFVGLGKIYGILNAYFILDDIGKGDWRKMLVISCIPSFFLFFGTYFFLLESPRYFALREQYENLKNVFILMLKKNNKTDECISDSDIQKIKEWREAAFERADKRYTVLDLFQKKTRMITIKLWTMWFFFEIMSKGQILVLPFILGKSKHGFRTMIITILGEFPAIVISLLVIENPAFGRRRTICIFFFFSFIVNTLCFLEVELTLFLFLSRLIYRELSAMLYTYTTEIYPTPLRALGIGWGICAGKTATCVMSFALFRLLKLGVYYPFLLFAVASLLSSVCGFFLKGDTTGVHLDQEESESKPQSIEMNLKQGLLGKM